MSKNSRKNAVVQRLRRRLQIKSESLADQFEFRMYVAFKYKDTSKPSTVYRAAEVIPIMTNNYALDIMQAAKESQYSIENGKNTIEKDFVQLHVRDLCNIDQGRLTPAASMDFLVWPRSDIDRISCAIFSRWKRDKNAPFKHIQQDFCVSSQDYQWQIECARQQKLNELVINNSGQTMFMLVSNRQATEERAEHCKLSGICLFLPQAKLMTWDIATEEDVMKSLG